MIMVSFWLAGSLHKKAAGGVATCGDWVIQSSSQPQARARRPKVIKEIPTAEGVVHLLAAQIHARNLPNRTGPSSSGSISVERKFSWGA
jgi:hypothetical protein